MFSNPIPDWIIMRDVAFMVTAAQSSHHSHTTSLNMHNETDRRTLENHPGALGMRNGMALNTENEAVRGQRAQLVTVRSGRITFD